MVARGLAQLRTEWHRASLLPFRLGVLGLTLAVLVLGVIWQARQTELVQRQQAAATQWLGQTGWRVEALPSTMSVIGSRRATQPSLEPLTDALALLNGPEIWLMRDLRPWRDEARRDATWVQMAFANVATGLRDTLPDGSAPCIWLGLSGRDTQAWWMGPRLRCERQPVPAGWVVLQQELGSDLLVLPLAMAPSVVGPRWRLQASRLWTAGPQAVCTRLGEQAGLAQVRCSRFAATRGTDAAAVQRLAVWDRGALPFALLAAWAAGLFYQAGLWPLMGQELALRRALGARRGRASAQLMWAALRHSLLQGSVVLALAMAVSYGAFGLLPKALYWTAALVLLVMPCSAVAWTAWHAWRERDTGLAQLGRMA